MIGNHRYFYNEGIKYLHSLPRGFFIPEKGSLKAANYIKYENEYFLVETGGKYAYGIIPKYDTNKKQINQTNFIAIEKVLKDNPETVMESEAAKFSVTFKTRLAVSS